jgi:hypothetical protein
MSNPLMPLKSFRNGLSDTHDPYQLDEFFCDLPTALKSLFGRLDDYLQLHPTMVTVDNPVLPSEKFTRHWDDEKYKNFRDKVHDYREWIDDAYDEKNRDESIRKWRRVFGEEFAEGEVVEKSADATARALNISGAVSPAILDAVRRGLRDFLDRIPRTLPHVEPLRWRPALGPHIQVTVKATVHSSRGGELLSDLISGSIVKKERWIRFEANALMPNNFYLMWQVVNTGEAAAEKKGRGLRGGFYKGDDRFSRWESTEYTGAHWVEAFVVNRRTRECVGRSGRFFVVVE